MLYLVTGEITRDKRVSNIVRVKECNDYTQELYYVSAGVLHVARLVEDTETWEKDFIWRMNKLRIELILSGKFSWA